MNYKAGNGARARLRATICTLSLLLAAGGPQFAIARDHPVPQTGDARGGAPTASARSKPNVLFLILDDMNTRLGAYGAPVRTPSIDRFARQGLRFDNAYTQWPVCGPSRASLMTGMRPDAIGRSAIYERFRCTHPNTVTLPQLFQQAGYFSARVGKVYHQGVPTDIGRDGPDDAASWNVVVNPRGLDKDEERNVTNATPGLGLGRANSWLALDAPDEALTDGKVASEAIRLLRENAERPFFMAVGFYRPHVPEIAPKRYFEMYPPEKARLAKETPASLEKLLPASVNSDMVNLGMTVEQQRQMIAAYNASTSFADAQVGRVLSELDRLGLSDNTIVVALGDHGFMLGEHGQWQKSLLWEEATHFPLIIRAPGMKGARSTRQIVEMVDIYPTVAELAGLGEALRGVPQPQGGRSLAPIVTKPGARLVEQPALSQILGGRSVRTSRYRYTEWEGGKSGRELYDLRRDPLEHKNLAENPRYAGIVAQLSMKLPQGPIEARGHKTLSNPQNPQPRRGGPPIIKGCEDLEALIE